MSRQVIDLDPNSRAHQCLSVFHTICDDYNRGELKPEFFENDDRSSCSQLRILQSMTLEAFDLIKFLYSKDNCEATRQYMIFCGKILLRLSHLIHNKRIETDKETQEYFTEFMTKYDLRG